MTAKEVKHNREQCSVVTIVIAIAFQVTSIPVETILNIHYFITCCVYLHIGIDSI